MPPKIWVRFASNGMPVEVQKGTFCPTINHGWVRVFLESELDEVDRLEAQIRWHMDAMKPLLDKWQELRAK